MKIAAVGGTFDYLHNGHKELIMRAFAEADRVIVGLTSDEMLEKEAGDFDTRKKHLQEYLEDRNYEIVKLTDTLGPAAWARIISVIVVSEETLTGADRINDERKMRGIDPLEIILVPTVMAGDGKPISSSRIRRGEIDQEGKPV